MILVFSDERQTASAFAFILGVAEDAAEGDKAREREKMASAFMKIVGRS